MEGYNWNVSKYDRFFFNAIEVTDRLDLNNVTDRNLQSELYPVIPYAKKMTALWMRNCDWQGSNFSSLKLEDVSETLIQCWFDNGSNMPVDIPLSWAACTKLGLLKFPSANFDVNEINLLLQNSLAAIQAGMGSEATGTKKIQINGTNAIPTDTATITALESAGWVIERNS